MSSLIKFTESPHEGMSKDTLELKQMTKGSLGTITDGGKKICTAIKLGPNLFVTTDNIPKSDQILASLGEQDLHVVRSRADMIQFVQRYEVFKRG